MIEFAEYKTFVESLDDDALCLEISVKRDVLARFDAVFAALREAKAAPEDESVEASTRARVELRLAERELAKRYQSDFGVSPSSWIDEVEEGGETEQ